MKKYIMLQRTQITNPEKVAELYWQSIQEDYDTIKNHLPDVFNCLDIGCGIAGIDLMLYRNNDYDLNLLDYSKTDNDIYYGYKEKGCVYNSLELAEQFLVMNGVDKNDINLHDAGKDGISSRLRKVDVVISLISCGFHYPAMTYMRDIILLNPKIIILDIRKGSGEIEHIRRLFKGNVTIIADYQKYERILIKNENYIDRV